MKKTRVVITGLGSVNPLGSSTEKLWDGLTNGRSGISQITHFDASDLPCQIAGEIQDFNPIEYMDRKEARRVPRAAKIALASAIQAVKDAGLQETMPNPERAGVYFGTANGDIHQADVGIQILRSRGYTRVNPFTLPSTLPNLPAFLIARRFNCLGPNATITTACATSTQAIGEGAELIRRGSADIVIVGGTEAQIHDYTIGGFSAMRALPVNFNNSPEAASRPFDADREGFVLSEGAASLVIESLEHAQTRGARIYAEFAGHASSADALHIAAPDPEAAGPIRAMLWALKDAGINPEDVDYINAHGSSTPKNDAAETQAIKTVFGDHAYKIPISSTKSMLGHAMGAAGALEALACTLTIKKGKIHPTINYDTPDPKCDLDYVPNVARDQKVDIALSNSFGLGGQNACLILKRYQA